MKRSFLIALSVAVACAAPARGSTAPSPSDAKAFIEGVYRGYCDDCRPPGFNSARLSSPRLLALARRDKRMTPKGYVGALDGDPICDCQDWQIRNVRVEVRGVDPIRAEAVARFSNGEERETVRFELVVVRGHWRIDNIHSNHLPDLAEHLRRHAGGR